MNRKGEKKQISPGWILSFNLKNKTVSLFNENGIQIFSGDDDKFYVHELSDYGPCINLARAIAWSHGFKADIKTSSGHILKFEFVD